MLLKVYLVKTNGLVLAAYSRETTAQTHARTVTGAHVEAHDVLQTLASQASDDAATDEWEDNGHTPVETVDVPTIVTRKDDD